VDPEAGGQQNIAFMPALPMLMRFGGRLIGGHPLWAGQIVVLVACLWAFVYVYRLARSALGDADRAAWAVALLAAYPFAVFFSAVYTESIFLLCAAGRSITSAAGSTSAPRRSRSCAGLRGPTGFCSRCRSRWWRSGRRS